MPLGGSSYSNEMEHFRTDVIFLCLFVMGPHAQHMNNLFFFQYFIDETVLVTDASGIQSFQISVQSLVRRRIPVRIFFYHRQQFSGLCLKSCLFQKVSVLGSPFAEYYLI